VVKKILIDFGKTVQKYAMKREKKLKNSDFLRSFCLKVFK